MWCMHAGNFTWPWRYGPIGSRGLRQQTEAMHAIIRKYSSSLLTVLVYSTIILFSLLVSLDLV